MKKILQSSILGFAMLSGLAQAHQFSEAELSLLSDSSTSDGLIQTIVLKVSSPLADSEKEMIYVSGIESIVYAGDLSYYLYGNTKALQGVLSDIEKVKAVNAIVPSSKVSSSLDETEASLTSLAAGAPLHFNVILFKEMNEDALNTYFEDAGIDATISNVTPSLKSAKIRIAAEDYDKVKSLSLIQYMDESHSLGLNDTLKETRNLKTATYENVTALWTDSYNLHGEGMDVAVVDGGYVRKTHQEFVENGASSVVVSGDSTTYADHATHVAGTIIADGDDEDASGVASGATLYSYSFTDSAFADIVMDIYRNDGVLISNHSYGYSEMAKLGEYDSEAVKQDRAVASNPFLNIFEAAGNDGDAEGYPAYGKIKGPGNSKNILTIGALNVNTSGVASFSSNGPTLDGRIKPELCTRGEGVYSTGSSSDTDYFWMNGTSMATPSATGIGVLASQAYKKVSGGYDIRHDILTACMINTAVDKGRTGPDFDTGFGMIDAKATVDTINSLATTAPLVYADSVSHQTSKEMHFSMPTRGTFKATISWVDPEANPSSTQSLVNDIDMWLENASGQKFYPYTLDASNPTALAVSTKQNHVDNNEQIEVKNLEAGSYTLVIKGQEIVTSSQEFALASNISVSSESNLDVLQPSDLKNFEKVIQNAIY